VTVLENPMRTKF